MIPYQRRTAQRFCTCSQGATTLALRSSRAKMTHPELMTLLNVATASLGVETQWTHRVYHRVAWVQDGIQACSNACNVRWHSAGYEKPRYDFALHWDGWFQLILRFARIFQCRHGNTYRNATNKRRTSAFDIGDFEPRCICLGQSWCTRLVASGSRFPTESLELPVIHDP